MVKMFGVFPYISMTFEIVSNEETKRKNEKRRKQFGDEK